MDREQAARNLEVIRTLMERSVLYRRALAPLMFLAGSAGVAASLAAHACPAAGTARGFAVYWMSIAAAAGAAGFALMRRQAMRASEPVWSPPAVRVVQALAPAFLAGAAVGLLSAATASPDPWMAACLWHLFYGCGLHAAGFFVPRGIRLFGWIVAVTGAAALALTPLLPADRVMHAASDLMGFGFGLLHAAYACYLRATEARLQDPPA